MSRLSRFKIGLIAIAVCIGVALMLTMIFGPLFGAWDWQATSVVFLVSVTFIFLSLDSASASDSPSARIAPGSSHGASPGDWDTLLYPQTYDGGAEPQSRGKIRTDDNTRWFRQSLLTAAAAAILLFLKLV